MMKFCTRGCAEKNKKGETKQVISAQESQSKEKKTKALVDNPTKKETPKKKPGEQMTVNDDQEDIEPLVSSQKRKLTSETNSSPKKI